MKRWILALAVLVGGAVSIANADFVLLRAVLVGKEEPNNQQGEPTRPGLPGLPPGTPPGTPPGQPGAPGGNNIPTFNAGQLVDPNALTVQAIVPAKPKFFGRASSLVLTKYTQLPKGVTRLYNDNRTIFSFMLPLRSNQSVYSLRHDIVFKNRTSDKVLDLADWALTHGLVDDFAKLMDELVKNKDDESSSVTPALKEAVKAYRTVKEALEKPAERQDATNEWKRRLSMRYEESKHYSLFYNSPVSNPPEVQSRLAMLEQHMKAYYYWFAMKGVALPMPKDKLVCVLLDQPSEFKTYRAVLEDEPLVADSFFLEREDVCVFSKERLDGPYQAFLRQTQPIYQSGFERESLLKGIAKPKVGMSFDELARYETLALLEKSLEEEGERAAVTHDGTRQLLIAAGVLPRTVVVPKWALFGMASFFETPKGPFVGAPVEAQVAFYPGIGAPSWAYLRPWRTMDTDKQMPPESQLLRDVVTDAYFHRVINAADHDGLLKARTTAWSLAYFLAKTRLPGLLQYCKELSYLPRDLELNDRALLAAFARAFDVANAARDGIDPAKFGELAKDWVAYMRGVVPPGAEFGLNRELAPGAPGTPGQGQPGGPASGGPAGGTPPKGGRGGRPGGGSGAG